MPISESMIVVPALAAMYNRANGEIQTAELIDEIANSFALDGQDRSLLPSRNDERFTQIVRNLKSHKTLANKGLAEEIDGGFRITDTGREFLKENGFV